MKSINRILAETFADMDSPEAQGSLQMLAAMIHAGTYRVIPTRVCGKTPETDAMTRLYREQVAPVLDTLAAGACTRILNKMGQIERERDEARAALAAPVEGEVWRGPHGLFDPARLPARDNENGEQIHPDMAAFFCDESVNSEIVKKTLAGLGWDMEVVEWDEESCDFSDFDPAPPEENAGWHRVGFIGSEDGLFGLFVRPTPPKESAT